MCVYLYVDEKDDFIKCRDDINDLVVSIAMPACPHCRCYTVEMFSDLI